MQVNATAMGTPASFTITPQHLPAELAGTAPPKAIAVTVYSVPSGAKLSVDGKELGITPIAAQLVPGSHTLIFTKEGYNSGTFPMVVAADQLSGCLLYTSDAADEEDSVDLGGRRIIKKKKKK